MTVIVNGSPSSSVMKAAQEVVRQLDRHQTVTGVESLSQVVESSTRQHRFIAGTLSVFTGVALFLAVTGVYGVASLLANLRKKEMAVRLALGARPGGIARLMLRESVVQGVSGVICGLLGSWLLTRLVAVMLNEVTRWDPTVTVLAILIGLSVPLTACYGPALRSARVDPVTILKSV